MASAFAELMAKQKAARAAAGVVTETLIPVSEVKNLKPKFEIDFDTLSTQHPSQTPPSGVESTPAPESLLQRASARGAIVKAVVESAKQSGWNEAIQEMLEGERLTVEQMYEEQEFDSRDDEDNKPVEANDSTMFNILDGMKVIPDESQVLAYRGLAVAEMGCLIGAAGTGKTTTTKLLVNCLMNGDAGGGIEPYRIGKVDLNLHYAGGRVDEEKAKTQQKMEVPGIALVAFTGQATQVLKKNMPPAWRRNCMTIHSLLGYAPEEYTNAEGKASMRFAPTYTKLNRFSYKVIIIDEASMVNVDLWHQIRDAAPDDCRFYFIGDLNQLTPPIGEGILGFALAKLPVFELNVVHRSANDSENKIVDAAWAVLLGKSPTFEDPETNPAWRILGVKLDSQSSVAHSQIVAVARKLSMSRISKDVDPAQPFIYDPWRDRIMVTMNGENPEAPGAHIGQVPLNESLARIFANKGEERTVIDYKRGTKKFGVGYRIMATKNEPPDKIDRVTNGLTGKIVNIEPNGDWTGDWRLVGLESVVADNRRHMLDEALGITHDDLDAESLDDPADFMMNMEVNKEPEAEERQSGPASHVVTVMFDNGGTRYYSLNTQIEQLQIAYASTTHKAQGAEMPTAIVVIHHAQRQMLCRENLYTAVTRAKERVIILYTDFGLRLALATQKIRGSTLKEKIQKYIELSGEGGVKLRVYKIRLRWDD